MIIESLVITWARDGTPNLAPLGPMFPSDWDEQDQTPESIILRPFEGSTTLANLRATRNAVVQFSSDAELFAKTAIGKLSQSEFDALTCEWGPGLRRLARCQRVFHVESASIEGTGPRFETRCRVLADESFDRPIGNCRGFAAVIEAAVMATRLHLIDAATVRAEFERLSIVVEKTASQRTTRAFEFLNRYTQDYLSREASGAASDSRDSVQKGASG